MSTNIHWEPADRKKNRVGDLQLKSVLRKRYGLHERQIISGEDLYYLHGLRDAGVVGAEELIEAIGKYGRIVISDE